MKKILALMLVLATMLSFVACGPVSPDGPGPDGNGEYEFIDQVPTQDFGGDTITFALTEQHQNEIYKEELEPDACDVAIRDRNSRIENRFNVKIEQQMVVGESQSDFHSRIKNALMNGDAEFDVVISMLWLTGPIVTGGYYFDLRYDTPYIKDSIGQNEWWGEGVNNAFTIHDRQYVGSSDINLSALTTTWCIIFNKGLVENKRIAADLGEDTMYDVVKNNKWTLETFYNLAKDGWTDNPTGTTPGEVGQDDTFGVLANGMWFAEIAATAAGIRMIVNDGQSTPELTPFTSFTRTAELISQITQAKGFIGPQTTVGAGITPSTKFAAGEALFYATTFGTLDNDEIHDSDVEFGILPMPKGSTTQQKYNAGAQDASSLIGIPTSADNGQAGHFNAVCSVVEALAAESHQSVLPAYYDVILKHKNTRDEESLEMIDIIYAGRIFDFASIHSDGSSDDGLSFVYDGNRVALAYVMRTFSSNPTLCGSAWEAGSSILEDRLDDLISTYEGIYDRAE